MGFCSGHRCFHYALLPIGRMTPIPPDKSASYLDRKSQNAYVYCQKKFPKRRFFYFAYCVGGLPVEGYCININAHYAIHMPAKSQTPGLRRTVHWTIADRVAAEIERRAAKEGSPPGPLVSEMLRQLLWPNQASRSVSRALTCRRCGHRWRTVSRKPRCAKCRQRVNLKDDE